MSAMPYMTSLRHYWSHLRRGDILRDGAIPPARTSICPPPTAVVWCREATRERRATIRDAAATKNCRTGLAVPQELCASLTHAPDDLIEQANGREGR